MKKVNYSHFLAIVVIMTACTRTDRPSVSPATSSQSPTSPPTQTSLSPTRTVSPTHTRRVIPSSTFEPTLTVAPTETRIVIPVCPGGGIVNRMPDDFGITGTIVYQNNDKKGLYTIGGMPLMHSQLPVDNTQQNEVFGFSPNGEWLAYAPNAGESTAELIAEPSGILTTTGTIAFDTPLLVLLSAKGDRIESSLDQSRITVDLPITTLNKALRWPYSYWNNNIYLFILLYFWDLDPYSHGAERPILFDPFQGIWVQEPILGLDDRYLQGNVGFSPDLTRVLYETQNGDFYAGIQLRDLTTNDVLWSDTEFQLGKNTRIFWSPDSSTVAVSNIGIGQRFHTTYLISRDGKAKIIEDSKFPTSEFNLISLSWSPNSRYIAMVDTSGTTYQLYIYDNDLDQYLYYCPLISYEGVTQPNPIWSPDNSYIILSSSSSNMPIQIINVQTGEIFNLLKEGFAFGWSDKFPTVWP